MVLSKASTIKIVSSVLVGYKYLLGSFNRLEKFNKENNCARQYIFEEEKLDQFYLRIGFDSFSKWLQYCLEKTQQLSMMQKLTLIGWTNLTAMTICCDFEKESSMF